MTAGRRATGRPAEAQYRMEVKYLKEGKTKYTFGFANDPTGATRDAYHHPPAFGSGTVVVGKDGKVAFVDHYGAAGPHLLEVVGKVSDGSWKGQADADAIDAVRKEYGKAIDFHGRLYQMRDEMKGMTPEESLDAIAKTTAELQKTLDEFLKKHPEYLTEMTTLGSQVLLGTRAGDQKAAEKALAALLKPDLDIATVSIAGEVLNEIGRNAMFGGLKPEVAADKLFGMVIDAVLKSELVADRNGEYLMGIVRMTPMVGATDKGLELAKKLIDASTEIPADKKPELLKQFEDQLQQVEKQMKEPKATPKK